MMIFGCPPFGPKNQKNHYIVRFRTWAPWKEHYFWQAGSPGRRSFCAREAQAKDTRKEEERKEEGSNTPEARGPAIFINILLFCLGMFSSVIKAMFRKAFRNIFCKAFRKAFKEPVAKHCSAPHPHHRRLHAAYAACWSLRLRKALLERHYEAIAKGIANGLSKYVAKPIINKTWM